MAFAPRVTYFPAMTNSRLGDAVTGAMLNRSGVGYIMLNWALMALLAAFSAAFVSYSTRAAEPFSAAAFEVAQAAGKSILVDVTAPWCPTCRKQRPIVEDLEIEHPSLVVFEVDFDSAKDVLRRFRVRYQSTLIVFKGDREVGRSTGDTDPSRVKTLVAMGL